jgi:hypothetical protein
MQRRTCKEGHVEIQYHVEQKTFRFWKTLSRHFHSTTMSTIAPLPLEFFDFIQSHLDADQQLKEVDTVETC